MTHLNPIAFPAPTDAAGHGSNTFMGEIGRKSISAVHGAPLESQNKRRNSMELEPNGK